MVVIQGYAELRDALKHLPDSMTHTIISGAYKKASESLIVSAQTYLRSKTKTRTGNLVQSIGAVKMPIKKAKEVGETWVGPRRRGGYRGNHGHLIEFGTVDRYTKSGRYTGRSPKLPYMEPAFNDKKDDVLNKFRVIVGDHTASYLRRRIKKIGSVPVA